MITSLTPDEVRFLRDVVQRREGTGDPATPRLPIRPGIRSLIDRGYLKTAPAWSPIVGRLNEEILVLADAGREVLREVLERGAG